jgi:hypothetical protein
MPSQDDIAIIAGQLADLTRTVEEMAQQLKVLGERADSQQESTEIQQERIALAARELAEVSDRLRSAVHALQTSV